MRWAGTLGVVPRGQDEVHLGDVADVGRVGGAGGPERPDSESFTPKTVSLPR
mgnify:CR=1 FL=1